MITTKGETDGIRFHHNGDYSGEVVISVDAKTIWDGREMNRPIVEWNEVEDLPYWQITLPMSDLLALVAEYVRSRRTEALENATRHQLLGGTI